MHNLNKQVKVQILTENNNPMTEYTDPSTGRGPYIESRSGSTYSIRIDNFNYFRIVAVIAVDGINVINGKTSKGLHSEHGYVIDSNSHIIVKGFRISNKMIREFKFTDSSGYAEKATGNTNAIGSIGIALFREKLDNNRYTFYNYFGSDNYNNLSKSTVGSSIVKTRNLDNKISTEMGTRKQDSVIETDIKVIPDRYSTIIYQYRPESVLTKMGITIRSNTYDNWIDPFNSNNNYCKEY